MISFDLDTAQERYNDARRALMTAEINKSQAETAFTRAKLDVELAVLQDKQYTNESSRKAAITLRLADSPEQRAMEQTAIDLLEAKANFDICWQELQTARILAGMPASQEN